MQKPEYLALKCWCYANQESTLKTLKSDIKGKNHVWVTEEEAEEEHGFTPFMEFRLVVLRGNERQVINSTMMNNISQDKICRKNGRVDLGHINIGLECSNASITLELQPVSEENFPAKLFFPNNNFCIGRM